MIAPSEVFKCADGAWLAVSPTGEGFWRDFCKGLGQPDLAVDARFATAKARIANVDALSAELSRVFAAKPAGQWEEEFFALRVPAGKVKDVSEAVTQPLARLRAMVEEIPSPSGSLMRMLGSAFKFDSSPTLAYPPKLGAHTFQVLGSLCAYPNDKLQQLADAGAVVQAA
jgi:crotonobetainyl-CoA:carnitine CoA-transferase CaiB-like acyl-CoA transferase